MPLLEDEFGDIVRKARNGLGVERSAVAEAAGISEATLADLEGYRTVPTRIQVDALAAKLGLDAEALWESATESFIPAPLQPPSGVEIEAFTFSGMDSHGYLMHVKEREETLLVDPGGSPEEILSTLKRRSWRLTGILLTHGHGDHVAGLEGVLASVPAPVFTHPEEWRGEGCVDVVSDGEIRVGSTPVQALLCPGHTPNGLTFVTEGLAFVGDTLFAGSLGGAYQGKVFYGKLLRSAHRLLDLPAETIFLPGHGPATTASEERKHNPFLAPSADRGPAEG